GNDSGNTEDELIKNADKSYEVNYKSDLSLDGYFDNPATLIHKDGKKYIQMTGQMGQFIESLTINGTEVTMGEISKDGTYVMQFEIDGSLSDILDFGMVIDTGIPGMDVMKHNAKLSFEKISDSEKEPGKDPNPNPNPNSNPKPNPKPYKVDEDDALIPDKAYKIDFEIKKEDGITPSISNEYFKKPAYLFEKNGKKYVHLKITVGDLIKDLNNKYGKAVLVKRNKDGSIVLQLRVDDNLSDMKLNMHVIVPEGAIPGFPGYDENHDAIL